MKDSIDLLYVSLYIHEQLSNYGHVLLSREQAEPVLLKDAAVDLPHLLERCHG